MGEAYNWVVSICLNLWKSVASQRRERDVQIWSTEKRKVQIVSKEEKEIVKVKNEAKD